MSRTVCDASNYAAFLTSLVYLLNTSVSIRKSHLSAMIFSECVSNGLHSPQLLWDWSMVWSPFFHSCSPKLSHVLKGYAMLLTSCLSIKVSYKRSDAGKWKTHQRILWNKHSKQNTCWLNRIAHLKQCLMLVLWVGILVPMTTNRLHNLFYNCSLFALKYVIMR